MSADHAEERAAAWLRGWVDRHLATVLCGVLVYLTVLGGVTVFALIKVYHTADANRRAGCALRQDQQERYHAAIVFLSNHPNGVPGLATRADVLRSISGLARNVRALSALQCDQAVHLEPPPPNRTSVP